MDHVIYHNPDCGTSRNTLALIRNAGIEPHMVEYLKTQGEPSYLDAITEEPEEPEAAGLLEGEGEGSGDDLYDQAVAIIARDRKVSTSYIQRRLQIGYNRAARIIEKMEEEGVISAPNHAGKREILISDHSGRGD